MAIDSKEIGFPLNEFSNIHFLKKILSIDYKRMVNEQNFNEKEVIDVDKSRIVDEMNDVDKNEN